jgi:hypothetical protein
MDIDLDLCPGGARIDQADCGPGDAITCGDVLLFCSRRKQCTNLPHLLFGQSGMAISDAVRSSAPACRITHVLLLGTDREMFGVDTRRCVAGVDHEFMARKGPAQRALHGQPVRVARLTRGARQDEAAISVADGCGSPEVAVSRPVHFRIKSGSDPRVITPDHERTLTQSNTVMPAHDGFSPNRIHVDPGRCVRQGDLVNCHSLPLH